MIKDKFLQFYILLTLCFLPILALSDTPGLILHNANVITFDETLPAAQALAIDGNHILAVGSNEEILALIGEGSRLIDLKGRTVVPGLIEAHSHRLQEGFQNSGLDGLVNASKEMSADGYTTVHELFGDIEGFIPALQTLSQQGRLAVRVNTFLTYNSNCGEDKVSWQSYPYTEKKDTTLRIAGVKMFADGGSCFCPALTKPRQLFIDECGPFGHLFKEQENMNLSVVEVLDAGYPITMHAIGDSAVGVGLNAFENAFAGKGNQLRCRIEHIRVMREDLANQMAELGIAASIQFTWAIAQRAQFWEEYYLPEVLDWVYSWRKLADLGIPIVGGNDYPYFFHSPQAMQPISLLATRKYSQEEVLPLWMDNDKLTVEEGLSAMVETNAWIAHEEEYKGSVTPGKLADLTILSNDPLKEDPFHVRNITIDMTIMDGIIQHDQVSIGPNIALNKTVTASNNLVDNPPALAVDGDLNTFFFFFSNPPQWIEVDLGSPSTVRKINLMIDQFPAGQTKHNLSGRVSISDSLELFYEFEGPTSSGEVLEYTFTEPWIGRFIRVETLEGSSSVAWKEIEILNALPTTTLIPEKGNLPKNLILTQNYPNPFNPKTKIKYTLSHSAFVNLVMFDISGREIRTIVNSKNVAGEHIVTVDASELPSGVYIYTLRADKYKQSRKMLLLR